MSRTRITFEQQMAKGNTRAAALDALLVEGTWTLAELVAELNKWQAVMGSKLSSEASVNAHLAHLRRRGRLITATVDGKVQYTALS